MRALRLACLLAVIPATSPAFAAMPLAAHRAVYDLELDKSTERSGIKALNGRMVYEFNGSPCDGYTSQFRFVMQITNNDTTRITDQQTSTYEDGAGKSFNFVTKSFVDQAQDKELKGTAEIQSGKLVVNIDKPEKKSLDLKLTQFPTRHLQEVIAKANAGETFYETNLFDGSENADKVMTTTVVIGKKQVPDDSDPEKKALGSLGSDGFWPVDISYFDESSNQGEGVPSYRIHFELNENGMSRDLVMDYGDFSMKGTLVNFTLLPQTAQEACKVPPAQ